MPGLLSVRDAAEHIGVSDRRIRALVSAGRLPAQRIGRQYLIDSAALAALRRARREAGRPLSAQNAWGLLAELAGSPSEWVRQRSRSRLRQAIEKGPDYVERLLLSAESRAHDHALRLIPGDLDEIRAELPLVPSGLAAGYLEVDVPYLREQDALHAYVSVEVMRSIERRYRPIDDSQRPDVVLSVPVVPWILGCKIAPRSVVAADLLLHPEPRVAKAGRRLLRKVVDAYLDS